MSCINNANQGCNDPRRSNSLFVTSLSNKNIVVTYAAINSVIVVENPRVAVKLVH